jgi:hypothetical protein
MADPLELASEGLGLTPKQRGLIIRVLWVLGVTTTLVYILGGLAFMGFTSPLAKAEDLRNSDQKIAAITQQVEISARLQLMQEIRTQKRVYCTNDDDAVRVSTLRYLNVLVDELKKVSNIQENPYPDCKP